MGACPVKQLSLRQLCNVCGEAKLSKSDLFTTNRICSLEAVVMQLSQFKMMLIGSHLVTEREAL